jgi:hypothetical protein
MGVGVLLDKHFHLLIIRLGQAGEYLDLLPPAFEHGKNRKPI